MAITYPDETVHKVAALLASSTLSKPQISDQTGVPLRTIYNWLGDPVFKARVDGYAAAAEDGIRAKLRETGGAMVDVLRDIAQDGEQESNRRQAAKDLLTFILGNRTEVKHSGGVHVEAHDPAQMEEAAARAREEADAARARLAELEAKSAQGAE